MQGRHLLMKALVILSSCDVLSFAWQDSLADQTSFRLRPEQTLDAWTTRSAASQPSDWSSRCLMPAWSPLLRWTRGTTGCLTECEAAAGS